MPRTQNDTGRAYEYAIVDYFENQGYALGPLASYHSSLYEDYFLAQTPATQRDFQESATDFFNWFKSNFASKVSKYVDGLPDNSGSVVDIYIGDPGAEINFSLKHNHLPPSTLFQNITDPLSQFLMWGPIILFLARVNRGGWPKWIEKLALRFKLITPVGALD